MIKTEKGVIKVKDLKSNPNNPRKISPKRLKQLKTSIMDFGEMLEASPVVVDEDNIVLGGNMRLRALKELGIRETPYVKVTGLTEDKKKEFIVKDNLTYGDWDWDILTDTFEVNDLKDFGMDIPSTLFDEDQNRKQDLNTINEQFDTWLNNDEKSLKLYFNMEGYVFTRTKLDSLLETEEVETYGQLVRLLCDRYFTKYKLKLSKR